MQVLRDSDAIKGAVADLPDVGCYLSARIEELSDYDGYELGALLNVVVAGADDGLSDVTAAIGFDPASRPADAIEVHPGWYEITYVLSDDGFGLVVYVPDHPNMEGALLKACQDQLARCSRS